jgi:hypothetical protein
MKTLSSVTQVGLDNHRTFGSVTARNAAGEVVWTSQRRFDNHRADSWATPRPERGRIGW